VDEALYRQIGAASPSQALVLLGDCNHVEGQHSRAQAIQEVPGMH